MTPRRNARATARSSRARRPTTGRRRALGQHFLRDEGVARRIVGLLAPARDDLALEIGPGHGALTGRLAAAAGRLVALELDPELAAKLAERFSGDARVAILTADALRYDYAGLAALRPDPSGRILIAGNLPYSVGTAILGALLDAAPALARVTPVEMALMLQREVAERVTASPGSRAYGSLSVLSQIAAEVRLAFAVPPGAFSPPPLVDSAVLHLRALASPPVPIADPQRFRAVVLAAFSQRRKMLANALAAGLGLPVARLRAALPGIGLDPARRAETLTLADFSRLADELGLRS
jgi:16S rRNA (adenine1518-N6/adenine1519-N6)-dimethyltransferase